MSSIDGSVTGQSGIIIEQGAGLAVLTAQAAAMEGAVIDFIVQPASRVYFVPEQENRSGQNFFEMHDGETLDFTFNLAKWLLAIGGGDSIVGATISLYGATTGVTLGAQVNGNSSVLQWISTSGAAVGGEIKVACLITTTLNRIKVAQFTIRIVATEAGTTYFVKPPSDILDVQFDFDSWIHWTASDDSVPADVAQSTIAVTAIDTGESPALLLGAKTHPGANVVKQVISGGTNGTEYYLTCTLTTTIGRKRVVRLIFGAFA